MDLCIIFDVCWIDFLQVVQFVVVVVLCGVFGVFVFIVQVMVCFGLLYFNFECDYCD